MYNGIQKELIIQKRKDAKPKDYKFDDSFFHVPLTVLVLIKQKREDIMDRK